uniref:Uncharacterized protein n=1 Tax=Triticum urartu TaxID=4572 RepID=A0A8R7QYS8_TRIUA
MDLSGNGGRIFFWMAMLRWWLVRSMVYAKSVNMVELCCGEDTGLEI